MGIDPALMNFAPPGSPWWTPPLGLGMAAMLPPSAPRPQIPPSSQAPRGLAPDQKLDWGHVPRQNTVTPAIGSGSSPWGTGFGQGVPGYSTNPAEMAGLYGTELSGSPAYHELTIDDKTGKPVVDPHVAEQGGGTTPPRTDEDPVAKRIAGVERFLHALDIGGDTYSEAARRLPPPEKPGEFQMNPWLWAAALAPAFGGALTGQGTAGFAGTAATLHGLMGGHVAREEQYRQGLAAHQQAVAGLAEKIAADKQRLAQAAIPFALESTATEARKQIAAMNDRFRRDQMAAADARAAAARALSEWRWLTPNANAQLHATVERELNALRELEFEHRRAIDEERIGDTETLHAAMIQHMQNIDAARFAALASTTPKTDTEIREYMNTLHTEYDNYGKQLASEFDKTRRDDLIKRQEAIGKLITDFQPAFDAVVHRLSPPSSPTGTGTPSPGGTPTTAPPSGGTPPGAKPTGGVPQGLSTYAQAVYTHAQQVNTKKIPRKNSNGIPIWDSPQMTDQDRQILTQQGFTPE